MSLAVTRVSTGWRRLPEAEIDIRTRWAVSEKNSIPFSLSNNPFKIGRTYYCIGGWMCRDPPLSLHKHADSLHFQRHSGISQRWISLTPSSLKVSLWFVHSVFPSRPRGCTLYLPKCARPDHRRVESSYEQGSPETALSSSDLKRFLFEALGKLGECGRVLAVAPQTRAPSKSGRTDTIRMVILGGALARALDRAWRTHADDGRPVEADVW